MSLSLQAVRLEALHRFTVLWHLIREIQTNRTMSFSRSFDRSVYTGVINLRPAVVTVFMIGLF